MVISSKPKLASNDNGPKDSSLYAKDSSIEREHQMYPGRLGPDFQKEIQ